MTTQNNPFISVKNFSIGFEDKIVIDNLSFVINKGETFGLLGCNGSGKTTTIRALLGIYQPSAGSLLIDGSPYNVGGNITLGYLPEERGLYKKEKVLDIMIYFGQLKGMVYNDAKNWSLGYLKRTQIEDYAHTRLDKLSGGMQQKVQVGIAVIGKPQLLILDEPTKGFDPVNRRLLMDIIEERQSEGSTVIFVTHQMEEVERLCDRILLLKDGTSYLYGTVEEVKNKFGKAILEIKSEKQVPKDTDLYNYMRREGYITTVEPKADLLSIQKYLLDKKISYTKFELKQPSLNDIFIAIYDGKNNGGL